MFPGKLKPFMEQFSELAVRRCVYTSQNFNIFRWQLEGCTFESHISGSIAENKSEVNVD